MTDNFTIRQLMERWDISRDTLARWRMEDKGPQFFKIGRKVFYPASAVTAYEAAQPRAGGGKL